MKNVNITVTTVAKKFEWYMLNYPKTNNCYWALKNEEDKILAEGNEDIPQQVIDTWGADDSIIENYLLDTARVGQ